MTKTGITILTSAIIFTGGFSLLFYNFFFNKVNMDNVMDWILSVKTKLGIIDFTETKQDLINKVNKFQPEEKKIFLELYRQLKADDIQNTSSTEAFAKVNDIIKNIKSQNYIQSAIKNVLEG